MGTGSSLLWCTCPKVYRNWLQQQPARLDWDRWLMMGLIGFAVGMLGFLLHQGR